MEYEYDNKSPDLEFGGKIAWIEGAGSEFRGAYRAGSRSSEYPYVVEFNDDRSIKDKTFPENCVVGNEDNNFRPIIIIKHDESIFQSHDSRRQRWLYKDRQFICPKGKGQGIMVSDFLLPNHRLSTISLKEWEKEKLALPEFASILFEYGERG